MISYSLYSRVDSKEFNRAFLYLNDEKLQETDIWTYSESGVVQTNAGRVLTLEASAGDKIDLRADQMAGDYNWIIFCANYIAKM